MIIKRPELARRGFQLAERALGLERVRQREARLRERVFERARQDLLDAARADEEPHRVTLIKRALGRHEALLSGYEVARARAWVEAATPPQRRRLLSALLDQEGEEAPSHTERLEALTELGASKTLGEGHVAHLNETVLSYLLAVAAPHHHAFIKLERAFQPAYRLLLDERGQRAPPSPTRALEATAFYSALAELWREQENFQGDLLDVHIRLFILGSNAYPEFAWARAIRLQDIEALVAARQHNEGRERAMRPYLEVAERMRACCVDTSQPQALYHGLQLEDYAHIAGQSQHTLSSIAEHGTRAFAPLAIHSADAFGVGVSREGAWRVAGESGRDRQEAETYFETRVLPALREINQVALLLRGERDDAELTVLARRPYRALDAKLLLLTLAALDPAWTFERALATVSQGELRALTTLLGVEPVSLQRFTDYLDLQFVLIEALAQQAPSLEPGAVLDWLRSSALGKLIHGHLEVNQEEEEEEEGAQEKSRLEEAKALEPSNRAPEALAAGGDPRWGAATTDRQGAPSSLKSRPSWRHHPAWRVEEELEHAWGEFIAALDNARHERLARLLRARKNVVLYGPPGTGKTVLSTQLATLWQRWQRALADNLDEALGADHDESLFVEQVTFHPSYGYEEFIEGFRPNPQAPGEFVLTEGLLTRLAERARRAPERCFLLLIDELNRGDVARIFGELITLIEADKRSPEHARRRMLSQRPLWLPPNLYVLATMNTADKSISLLDVAIRRRFAFERVPPQPELLDHTPGLVHHVEDIYLSSLLRALNARLGEHGIDPERWLGHSFLWLDERSHDDPLEALATRFRLDIIPLIEEYCFADRRQIRAVLGDLVTSDGTPHEALLASPQRLLEALRELIDDADVTDRHEPQGATARIERYARRDEDEGA